MLIRDLEHKTELDRATIRFYEKEGFIYQSTAPYMLSYYIKTVFALEEQAEALGRAAKEHACRTHEPEKNLQDLMEIYRSLM